MMQPREIAFYVFIVYLFLVLLFKIVSNRLKCSIQARSQGGSGGSADPPLRTKGHFLEPRA